MSSLEASLCVLEANVEDLGHCGPILDQDTIGHRAEAVNATKQPGRTSQDATAGAEGVKNEAAVPGLERLAV